MYIHLYKYIAIYTYVNVYMYAYACVYTDICTHINLAGIHDRTQNSGGPRSQKERQAKAARKGFE